MSNNKILGFMAMVRRFHYYKSVWQLKQNQLLPCEAENGNTYDMVATETVDDSSRIRYSKLKLKSKRSSKADWNTLQKVPTSERQSWNAMQNITVHSFHLCTLESRTEKEKLT